MTDFAAQAELFRKKLDETALVKYAAGMGVAPRVLREMGCGLADTADLARLRFGFGKSARPDKALVIPERDATGNVIGLAARALDGTKGSAQGSKRGLVYPDDLAKRRGPVLIVEGFGDLAACYSVHVTAIARPSCDSGAELLAGMPGLSERDPLTVADGDTVGLKGAEYVSQHLANAWSKSVRWTPSPGAFKDVRAWVQGLELDLTDDERCAAAGERLVETLLAKAATCTPERLTTCFAEIETKPITWLCCDFLPLGKLTMIAGHPGLGKSLVTIELAARLTRGKGMPEAHAPDGPVEALFLSAEDDAADTMRPRLEAAGADLSRCHFATSLDLHELRDMLRERPKVALVVIDPLSAYLGDVESHNDAKVRSFLAPFAVLAAELNVTILFVAHLRKTFGGPAVLQPGGSIAFTAAARVVWLVAQDRNDRKRRLLLPIKCNLGPDQLGWAFRVLADEEDGPPHVEWESARVSLTADDALREDAPSHGRGGAQKEAEEWLRQELANGPRPAEEMKVAADEHGIAVQTLKRAKKKLGVVSKKEGLNGGWVWRLVVPEEGQVSSATEMNPFEQGHLDSFEGIQGVQSPTQEQPDPLRREVRA